MRVNGKPTRWHATNSYQTTTSTGRRNFLIQLSILSLPSKPLVPTRFPWPLDTTNPYRNARLLRLQRFPHFADLGMPIAGFLIPDPARRKYRNHFGTLFYRLGPNQDRSTIPPGRRG